MSANPTPIPDSTDFLSRAGYAGIAVGVYSNYITDRGVSYYKVLSPVFCN